MSEEVTDNAELGLFQSCVDDNAYDNEVRRFRERQILLPTFAEIADPASVPEDVQEKLATVDPDAADPWNLFRVHWFNASDRRARTDVPVHLSLPPALTGVPCPILIVLGDRFPMVRAHKVLAAYACLAPRLVCGAFDPTRHRAVWPSTGNYARGGVAISRIMGCRGVAVLPEGMSRERFRWLDQWVADPADILRTPGSESNVKEIYDRCAELSRDPENVILNQFCEFGNHLAHYHATGPALGRVFEAYAASHPTASLRAYVSASGSAGTLGAGDYLKEHYGARITAVEALECPTLLYNGYGSHNIQGIGDKHVPLIHNVTNTDFIAAVSDRSTDELDVLFNTPEGKSFLVERLGLPAEFVPLLAALGYSSICNTLAAIKVAKLLDLGPDDVIVTVATDGAALYDTDRPGVIERRFPRGFDAREAAACHARHLDAVTTDHLLELSAVDRNRVFNLGYFTWVEQQGVPLQQFEARRSQSFWRRLHRWPEIWDERIREFNARTLAA